MNGGVVVPSTRWQERLSAIVAGTIAKPRVVEILRTPGLDAWQRGKVQASWEIDPDFFSLGGQLFGGYVAALADQVGCHAALTVLDDASSIRTSSLAIYFHGPLRQGCLSIDGRVVAESRTLIHVRVEFRLRDQDEGCAHAELALAKVSTHNSK